MISSLRARVVVLCAIVALLTAALGLWTSSHILIAVVDSYHKEHVEQAISFTAREEQRLIARMTYEVGDYAQWDDLYERMPDPSQAWAQKNLSPGSFHGALNRGMALITEDRITGRYLTGQQVSDAGSRDDPATGRELVELAHGRPGIFIAGGRILFAVSDQIIRTDLSGPSRGTLLGYRYFDDDLRQQLTPIGWELVFSVAPPETPLQSRTVTLDHDMLVVHEVRTVPGGAIIIDMRLTEDLTTAMRWLVIQSALIAGAMGVLLSSLLGSMLGWHWMEPIRLLAKVCRQRSAGANLALPDCMGLRETADLAADLTKLVEAEQHSRIALQSALEQVQTAHAVQSRFAERLTGELTEPLRTLSALMGRIQVGHVLDAGAIIEAQEALTRIEGRLSASVAFNQHSRSRASTDLAVHLPTWTEAVVRGLEQRAAEHGVRLMAQADDTDVQINVQLLMPLLIHLVSNAINATSSGLDVTLCAQVSGRFVSFTVIDQGLGMPPQLLASLRMACARGEVMPGEPGIGFGLSLVIERSAQLGGHLEILRSDAHGTHIRLTIELIPR